MTTEETSDLLTQGIAAARSGKREEARQLLSRLVELDDHNETGWLWLSGVVDDLEDQVLCLENVLTINPHHRAARLGLERLAARQAAPSQPGAEPEPKATESEEAEEGQPPAAEQRGRPREEERHQEAAAARPAAKPAGAVEQDARACPNCGSVNPGWHRLCSRCGEAMYRSAGAEVAKGAPSVSAEPMEPDDVILVSEYDTRPQGLLMLLAAWIAALAFNKRGAYEYEIFSASAGRTLAGIVVGGVALPALITLLAGVLVAASVTGGVEAALGLVTAAPLLLVGGGVAAASSVIIQFYLWAAVIYLIGRLLGGRGSFTVHAQLLSVSYSAGGLVASAALAVGAIALSAWGEASSGRIAISAPVIIVAALLGLAAACYALAMQGQALSVAHRLSWLGATGIDLLGSLLYGLLAVFLGLLFLLATDINPAAPGTWPAPISTLVP